MPKQSGALIIQALVFGAIGIILIGGLVSFAQINIKSARLFVWREKAFQIAEAGVEYYRWHLAHAPQDFQDGTGAPGPYVHPYKDKDSEVIGSFTLTITPPIIGSTIVTVISEGKISEDASISRKIEAKLAIPSLAKYAFVANSAMRFGKGTEVFGPIHSNDGIRFDGLAHNIVTSAKSDYDDADHLGNNEFAVHTHRNLPGDNSTNCSPSDPGVNCSFRPQEAPPTTPVPSRSDVFLIGRQFPVPAVNFAGLTTDLADIRADTLPASGLCTPDIVNGKLCFAGSGALGYNLVLKTNDTFDLFKVTSLVAAPSGCTNYLSQSGWSTWSINNQSLLGNYAFPSNGLIFLEDNVWIEGQIQTARLTIASGKFPDSASTNTSIIINKDIRYTTYDGQDVIALIAQNNLNVGMVSNSTLTIDAALLAKNGRVGRYYYRPNANWPSSGGSSRCSPYHTRPTINLFGMIATNLRYGFAYTDGTGYITRNITYDGNLLYGPPPSFPLTSDQYSTISWREL
jgi:hypothetical protein